MESITTHIKTEILQLITAEQAWHYGIIPKTVNGNTVEFFTGDINKAGNAIDELEVILNKSVQLVELPTDGFRKALSQYYRRNKVSHHSRNKQLNYRSGDFLTDLIAEANQLKSSDIHLEHYDEKCRVRLRIDGKLKERYIIEKTEYPAIVNKIKILANLDISEKRLPQDGRIHFQRNNEEFDIRVSVLPTLYGEKIVLRLLSRDATNIELSQLGLSEWQQQLFSEGIKNPHGIVLVSGPTGSGKTTTLYATLKQLNKEETNILTIEDPVEYTLEGINQVQLKENIGLTFASALRTFLRQDPDIIMLGEIRDAETAHMAVRASLTGHLVLSTVHTNSAWGIVSRLRDMGVPTFLLASTLNMVVSQRLIRLLCEHCKEEEVFDPTILPHGFEVPRATHSHHIAQGCEECYYTGYKGRTAIYEIIPVDVSFSKAIRNETDDVSDLMKTKKIHTLPAQAFDLFHKGSTSIEEVYPILKTEISD